MTAQHGGTSLSTYKALFPHWFSNELWGEKVSSTAALFVESLQESCDTRQLLIDAAEQNVLYPQFLGLEGKVCFMGVVGVKL